MRLKSRGLFVYILRQGEEVLYVGQTTNYLKRIQAQHSETRDFDTYELIEAENRDDLNALEFTTIAKYKPTRNRVYPHVSFLIPRNKLKIEKRGCPEAYVEFDLNSPDYTLPISSINCEFWVIDNKSKWVAELNSIIKLEAQLLSMCNGLEDKNE
jgi:hypothetical protein